MNQLLFSTYAVNFREYDQAKEILDACSFANLGLELSMFSAKSQYPDFMESLAKAQELFAPYYITFHGPYSVEEASSPLDSPEHAYMIESYRQAFRFCRDFSSHTMVIHTNQKMLPGYDREQLKQNSIATILELGRMSRELGGSVQLLVENVGIPVKENVLFPMEEFIQLFDRLPQEIGCLIDVGHAFDNRWDLSEVIRRLGSRITTYHLHNNDGVHDSHRMMLEEGLYYTREDWKKLFAVMEEYTPHANWTLEYSPKNVITPEIVAGEIRELLAMLEEVKG